MSGTIVANPIRGPLRICAACGRAGFDHRAVGVLVNGRLAAETRLCIRHADALADELRATITAHERER